MKIGIDIRSTLGQSTEIGQYTLGILKGLAEIDKENKYYLYCQKGLFSRHKRIPKFKAKNFKVVNDRFKRGASKVLKNIDVFFSPAVDFVDPGDVPMVANVHDLSIKAYPKFYDKKHIDNRDGQIKRVLGKADKIICGSSNTRRDLKKFYSGYDKSKSADVVYPGVDKEIFNTKINSAVIQSVFSDYNINIPYVLSVVNISKIKNLSVVLKGFSEFKRKARTSHMLVLTGAMDSEYSREKLLSNAGVNKRVRKDIVFTEHENGERLANLYKAADMFLFPSLYEGFGIPIVEAFACGIPVITSKTSACGEVAGNAAVKVNSEKINELSDALIDISKDSVLKKQLAAKSIDRAKHFDWEKSAEKLLGIFKKVCK